MLRLSNGGGENEVTLLADEGAEKEAAGAAPREAVAEAAEDTIEEVVHMVGLDCVELNEATVPIGSV